MINFKIDRILLNKAKMLGHGEKIQCIISTDRFERLKKFLERKKIDVLDEYLFINSFLVSVTRDQVKYLASLTQVNYIYSVGTTSMMMYVSKKILGVDKIDLNGKGVTVAIIDTGIFPHKDFLVGEKRIKGFIDFVNGKNSPYDDNGHGTFVSGVLAGNGASSSLKFSGVAPQSDIYALKALDKNGEAYSNKILDAMEWIFDHHKENGIKVVCMSFGSDPLGYNDPIMAGAEALWREGITVVAAAGNSGPENQTIKSPGVSRKIITVGGFDDNRFNENLYDEKFFEIAEFSSRGPSFRSFKPDLIAPAVDIISCKVNGGYTMLSGTSVATPMVAGLCSLLIQKHPNLTPDEVKREILSTCSPLTYNRNSEGFGIPKIKR